MKTLVSILLSLAALGVQAQPYPSKAIRYIVPFAPGGTTDILGRMVAAGLSSSLGQPVVVENKPGQAGSIGSAELARAAPDGYTVGGGTISSHAINVTLYPGLPYDPVKDFAPISQVFVAANILVVHPDVPAHSLTELVALAKAKPGELTYGHTGPGTSQHLAGELFKSMAHLDIRPIAYRGTTAVLPDLLAGRISMSFSNIVNVTPLVKEGKLRAFAVSSRKRSALVPELPTMAESGFPGYEAVPWFGLMAPAKTPQAVIDKVHDETVKVLAIPEVRKALENQGLDVIGGTPAEFAEVIRTETPYWAKVIKEAGIKAHE
jgi:tripartite-type tricarboxylate transporter receptor subunit TctC